MRRCSTTGVWSTAGPLSLFRPSSRFCPSATLSREGTSGITISSLHAGWILIEAQRIKLLKIRLSLLVELLVLLLLAHPPYPSSLSPRITAFRVGRYCDHFFYPAFLSRGFLSISTIRARRARISNGPKGETRERERRSERGGKRWCRESGVAENLFRNNTYKRDDRIDTFLSGVLLRVIKFA